MKNILLLCLALFSLVSSAAAQPEKGDHMIGGGLSGGYGSSSLDGKKQNENGTLSLRPVHGFCLGKGYVLGFGLGYSFLLQTSFDNNGKKVARNTIHNYSALIFSRHFTRITDKLYTWMGTTIAYTMVMNRSRNYDINYTSEWARGNNLSLSVRAGLTFFPKENIGIDFSYGELGYLASFSNLLKDTDRRVNHSLLFKYGVDAFYIGFVYFMRPKSKSKDIKR